ncbi:hypothetical protein NIES2104_05830 [Leptolyngbya sp. NIES-2104]|nr:hypothetical protein NIES2104_05830 [Leptolyngbya sp. NIES-2104]
MTNLLAPILTRPGMEFGASEQRSAKNHRIHIELRSSLEG